MGGRGKAQRENIGKLGSIVNLGSGCALRINDDSALPKLSKLLKLSKLPIFALITGGAKRRERIWEIREYSEFRESLCFANK